MLHWSLEAKNEIYKITQYFILQIEVKCGRRLGMRRLASPVNADEVFWIAQQKYSSVDEILLPIDTYCHPHFIKSILREAIVYSYSKIYNIRSMFQHGDKIVGQLGVHKNVWCLCGDLNYKCHEIKSF